MLIAPLRILEVSPYYEWAWAYGGVPRVVSRLAEGLAALGHEVTVCTTDARDADSRVGSGERPASGSRVRVEIFPNLSNAAAYHLQLFLPRGFQGWLSRRAGEFDVAHLHACRNLPVSLAARTCQRGGIPYLVAPHGTAPRIERRQALKRLYDLTVGRRDLRGAAAYQAVSEAERRQLVALGLPPERIQVVGNPIDGTEYERLPERGGFRQELGIGDRRLVLYLGRLAPRKRIDLLLRAFATLGDPEARLVIAGNDLGSGQELRRLARALGIESQISFPGLLEGQRRLSALGDADVVVNPAVDEVFGLVLVEALLCGTPVVAADDCGAPELFAGAASARLVRAADPVALASALRELSRGPEENRARARADGRALLERFDSVRVCQRLEAVFRDLVAGSVARSLQGRAHRPAREASS